MDTRVGRTLKLKDWVSVPGEHTLTPNVPVCPYTLVMELNSSDRGEEGEVHGRAYNEYKERFFQIN